MEVDLVEEGRIAVFLLKFLFKTAIKVILSCGLIKNQNLEKRYDALYIHTLIWNKIKKVCNFFSQMKEKNKGHVDEALCHVVNIEWHNVHIIG